MTDRPAYQPGERVRVTFEGSIREVRAEDPAWNDAEVLLQPGDDLVAPYIVVPLKWPGITINRLRPADGAPRPGQIWANRWGTELFAADSSRRTGRPEVHLHAPDGTSAYWAEVHACKDGPITLVRDVAEPAPELLLDPDCRDGKCGSCVGGPCEHSCHTETKAVAR